MGAKSAGIFITSLAVPASPRDDSKWLHIPMVDPLCNIPSVLNSLSVSGYAPTFQFLR
jgi:hypothetical protein